MTKVSSVVLNKEVFFLLLYDKIALTPLSTPILETTKASDGKPKENTTTVSKSNEDASQLTTPKAGSPSPLKRALQKPKVPTFKKRDYSNRVIATKCEGSVCLYNIMKPDDDTPAYKGDLNQAMDGGKEKNMQTKANVFAKVSYKAEKGGEDLMLVGKKGEVPDKLYVGYYEEGEKEDEVLNKNTSVIASSFMIHTKPYRTNGPKPKAKGCGITNTDEKAKLDEFLFDTDVAYCVTQMYSADMFVDNAGDDILNLYFGNLSLEDARDLVNEEFAKDEE